MIPREEYTTIITTLGRDIRIIERMTENVKELLKRLNKDLIDEGLI